MGKKVKAAVIHNSPMEFCCEYNNTYIIYNEYKSLSL